MGQEMYLAALVFFPFAAGLVSYILGTLPAGGRAGKGAKAGEWAAVLAAVLEFGAALGLALSGPGQIALEIPEVCGFGLTLVWGDLHLIYGCVAAFTWMMAAFLCPQYFAGHKNTPRFYLFFLWTLGAVLGVFLSGDLYTTFLFFEIMSFTSYVWVAQEEDGAALRAAGTYLAVAVIGGLVMLMGIFLLYHQLGTVSLSGLSAAAGACEDKTGLYAAGVCLLVGFGAKAGAFPLHIWLPKAHPAAPAPASALLSGVLTKTGIYGVLILDCQLFFGDAAWGKLIFAIGLITMSGGALLALFSVDIKRTLACSSMSQIGFILVGAGSLGILGEDGVTAVSGTFLHMVNHSLIKLVLFLAAGIVFHSTHALNLNEIRGFGRRKPFLACVFLTGALAISGVPLFGGYVSKSLLHESMLECGGWMRNAEILFVLSGGLTAAYMTKLFAAVFVEKNALPERQREYDAKRSYMTPLSALALGGSAAVLFVWGIWPNIAMEPAVRLAGRFFGLGEAAVEISCYTWESLKGALISLAFGAFFYVAVVRGLLMEKQEDGVRVYQDKWPKWLDLENMLYRPLLLTIFPAVLGVLCRILDSLVDTLAVLLRKSVYRDSPLPYERPEGNFFTEALGRVLNLVQALGNLTWNRKRPRHKNYVHLAAMRGEELQESNLVIRRSLSFGLLLFCFGLLLTLSYLIFW